MDDRSAGCDGHLRPSSPETAQDGFGAAVSDIDASSAAETEMAGWVEAFDRCGASLLRDEALSPDDLVNFIRRFGAQEGHTLQAFTLPSYPSNSILSNKVVNGVAVGASNDGPGRHADRNRRLWVSTGTVTEVVGMENPHGLALIDALIDRVRQERFACRRKWRVGDRLMWGNRCTLHTGPLYDDKK